MYGRIKQREGNLKEEYAESDREDGFQSHGSKIEFLSYYLEIYDRLLGNM